MLRRVLFIGVGGSGGKTLRFVRRELRWQLEKRGWSEEFPLGWQFLHIDVPTDADGNEPTLPPQLPLNQYLGLVSPTATYDKVDESVVSATVSPEILTDLLGWRPDPQQASQIPITKGAGQFRAIGRMIAASRLGAIRKAMRDRVMDLDRDGTVEQLARVADLLGAIDDGAREARPDPMVVMVSSIAGGSGAGAFLDVSDVLQSEGGWRASGITILYTPDVFEGLPELSRRGVYPNALAALSEQLAAYWNDEPASVDVSFLEGAGIASAQLEKRGARYPFLVGARNQKVQFGGQNAIYGAVGTALAAVATSPRAQDAFAAYLQTNWTSNSLGTSDHLDWRPAGVGENGFASFGFASVGLGRDRFARYASERLARAGVERVLRGHWSPAVRQGERAPEAERAELAERRFEAFLQRAGLFERGEEHNQIIDAIRPDEWSSRLSSLPENVRGQMAIVPATGSSPTAVAADIIDSFRTFAGRFTEEDKALLAASASRWVETVPEVLMAATAHEIGVAGGYVALDLLERTESELVEVADELARDEKRKFERWAGKLDEGVKGELAQFVGKLMTGTNNLINNALARGTQTIEWSQEAELRGRAAGVMRDFAQYFVRPLHRALEAELESLATEDQPPQGAENSVIRSWPEGDWVPPDLRPQQNERLVDDVEAFPSLLGEKLVLTFASDGVLQPGPALDRAVEEVIAGSSSTAIPISSLGWSPAVLGQAPRLATFEINLAAEELLHRAEAWVERRETPLGIYVHESLRDYLDETKAGPDARQRTARFRDAFSEALGLAAPLIDIDEMLTKSIHGEGSLGVDYIVTAIPLQGLPAGDAVNEVVVNARLDATQQEKFTTAASVGEQQRIDIVTALQAPLHAPVYRSLMEPIASEQLRRRGEKRGGGFWQWRRSRPLTAFVPVSPDMRRDMVTGWWVARALGQLEWDALFEQAVRIFDPKADEWREFPYPFLCAKPQSDRDLLPAVLESMPLVLLAMSQETSMTPMRPYSRLHELGHDAGTVLQRWIALGTTDAPSITPKREVAGAAGDSPDLRRDALVTWFTARQKRYEEDFSKAVTQREFFMVPPIVELREDMRFAFSTLVRLATDSGVGGEGYS